MHDGSHQETLRFPRDNIIGDVVFLSDAGLRQRKGRVPLVGGP
jgi:hypothetical protein